MFYSETRRPSSYYYSSSSTVAVAALAYLREQTFPRLVEPPQFIPSRRVGALSPPAVELARFLRGLVRPRVIAAAGVLALAIVVASTLTAWAALQPSSAATTALPQVHSSAGTTATAATRVEDLSVATFVGASPFFQQARYLSALEGATPEAFRFIQGAEEAPLVAYVQDIGLRVALPGLNDAVQTKQQVEAWVAAEEALAEAQRQAAAQAAASSAPVWRGSLSAGTRISGAYVTFYACVGNGFCGNTASGVPAQPGVAACSYNLPFGTRFVVANDPSQRVFTCLDRGALGPTWVDVWFYDVSEGYAWQAAVGTHSDIIIVQ